MRASDEGQGGLFWAYRELYRLDTGQTTTITTLPRQAGFGLSVAPDGTIVHTLIDRESSELVFVDNFR